MITFFLILYENPVFHCTIVPVTNISIQYDMDMSTTVEYHPFSGSGVKIDVLVINKVSPILFKFRTHNIIGSGFPTVANVWIENPLENNGKCFSTYIETNDYNYNIVMIK